MDNGMELFKKIVELERYTNKPELWDEIKNRIHNYGKSLFVEYKKDVNQELVNYLSEKSINKSVRNRDLYASFFVSAIKTDRKFFDKKENLETIKKIVLDEEMDLGVRATAIQSITRYFEDNNLFLKNSNFQKDLPKEAKTKETEEGFFMMMVNNYNKKYIVEFNKTKSNSATR